MLSLMKPDAQYYLSTLEYDPTVWPGTIGYNVHM